MKTLHSPEMLHNLADKVGQFEHEKQRERLRGEDANGAQNDSATHQRWYYRLARAFDFRVRSADNL